MPYFSMEHLTMSHFSTSFPPFFHHFSKMFQDPQVVVYNQSKHATNSVLADIRAVWGSRVRVIQTLEVPGDAIQSQVHPDFIFKFWENIFYIFRYILYIYIYMTSPHLSYILYTLCDSKIFSPHHGQNQWLLIGCFSIRSGRQPAATRDGCSALRASQVLGRFGSFQRAIGFHVHPGEGRMVKDGEGT